MDNPVIELRGVEFSYNGAPVLSGVDFDIRPRDFACVVGPNGGGKTTLVRLILGLLRPGRGTVKVFGGPPDSASHRLGYLPQGPRFDPRFPVSVLDVVRLGTLARGAIPRAGGRRERESAEAALREVSLWERRLSPFSELSGGQRQRALIARALACEPELLLLDEPTAGLDLKAEHEIYDLLRRLNERLTILMVSHDLFFVSRFVNRVICVKDHVHVHQTGEITDSMIRSLYGADMRLVRHTGEDTL
ncbi:metal ABC transporter ATP-binding protein [bacterium]|nr:metal ABC transporter ATP-binding protein [bacterium]